MNKAYNRINWENYPSDNTPINETNLNKLDAATDEIDNRVITHEVTKATKEEVSALVQDVTFEEATGIITVSKKNGSSVKIDTKMEKIAINFSYNSTTQQIILTLIDGTKQYIDLSALITQYEFLDSDTIAVTIDGTGKVTHIVKDGSIKEKHLQPNYLADIKVESAKAESSANSASESERKSKEYMEQSKGIYESISTSGDVLGVKGANESTYRSGLVNLTAKNIGAMGDTIGVASEELNEEWEIVEGTDVNEIIYALGYGDGKCIIATSGYFYCFDDNKGGLTKGTAINNEFIRAIAYGNGIYVAVGYNRESTSIAYYSKDGINWTKVTVGGTATALEDVAYGNGRFIAVGNSSDKKGVMYCTTNGTTWSTVSPRNSTWVPVNFTSIAYGDNGFAAVASGSDYFAYTTDGATYTSTYTTTKYLYHIAYGNGVYVAHDTDSQFNNGNIMYSYDGIQWNTANTARKYVFFDIKICFGNNNFITGTDDGVYLKSTDGINWEEIDIDYDWDNYIYPGVSKITSSGNQFFTSGHNNKKYCLWNLEFKQTETDTKELILDTKEKADAALQKEDISQSSAITEAKQYALDAIEKNASIQGTMANEIAKKAECGNIVKLAEFIGTVEESVSVDNLQNYRQILLALINSTGAIVGTSNFPVGTFGMLQSQLYVYGADTNTWGRVAWENYTSLKMNRTASNTSKMYVFGIK